MKLKINLASGSFVEKNLLTAFKSNTGSYVIFDAEKTDSTGLPVIMVSKLQDNVVSNIIDANEWTTVKESLRGIVSGSPVEYISVNQELSGEDVFYKQLTLPVAYFDTLKNNYSVPTVQAETVPVNPTGNADVANVMPSVDNSQPVTPVDTTAVTPEMPQMPDINAMATEPTMDTQVAQTEVTPAVSGQVDFSQEKENFLKACENMFDALVTKMNK